MEHKTLEELRDVARVVPAEDVPLTRHARLTRWAELLEREPDRRLKTLDELEFVPRAERAEVRSDISPIAVAFADPVLRAAGLKGDRYGDAVTFFELSEGDAHRLLCSCLNGRMVEASRVAQRVRAIADRTGDRTVLACFGVLTGVASLAMLMAF